MPYKDPDKERASGRARAAKRREEKRLLFVNDPAAHPLLVIGQRWVDKWLKQGGQLLVNHSDEAVAARLERNRAKVRRHRDKYPERVLESAKKTYAKHGDKQRAKARERYTLIRETENARSRIYYAENTEKILAQKKPYRAENADHFRALHQQWAAAHPEKIVAYSAARRARKANVPVNDLTAAQWLEIKGAFNHRCAYCPPDCKACKKKSHKLTQDHVTPYINNGSNTVWNVVPACKSCNSKKHDGPPLCPVQPLLLTVAPSKRPKHA